MSDDPHTIIVDDLHTAATTDHADFTSRLYKIRSSIEHNYLVDTAQGGKPTATVWLVCEPTVRWLKSRQRKFRWAKRAAKRAARRRAKVKRLKGLVE